MSGIDWREIGINLSLVLLGILLAVGLVEGALRLGLVESDAATDRIEHRWCEGPSERMTFHERYGWHEAPGSQYLEKRSPALLRHLGVVAETWHLYTHDERGFRDTYDTGEDDVVVLGDSFTRGTLADDNATFPHLLDRWSPNTSFHNTGTGGYGTANELVVYRDMAERYDDHELVVLGYYLGNDLNDNVARRDGKSPMFALTERGLVQSHRPERPIDSPYLRAIHDVLDDHSRAYTYAESTLSALAGNATTVRTHAPVTGETLDRRLRLTRALVDAIRSEHSGADLLVLLIPTKTEINRNAPDAAPFWRAQREMLRSLAANHSDAHVVDLRPPLEAAKDAGHPEYDDRLYSENEIHMNEYGYRTVATTVHGWLRNRSYVAATPFNATAEYDRDRTTCP